MTWRAGPGGGWRGARDRLGVRRGTEATWQSPGGPHRAQEAHIGVATWQEATQSHGPRGRPCGGATDVSFSCVVKTQRRWSNKFIKPNSQRQDIIIKY